MISTTTLAISLIAAFTGGLVLAALIIWLVGRQSEETPRARRLALGRMAARARADTPAPLLLEAADGSDDVRASWPKVVVDERMPSGIAAVVGPKRADVFRVSDGEHLETLTEQEFEVTDWSKFLGELEGGDAA